MIGYFLTDQGRVRNHNEDAGGVYKNDAGQILAVVADGMGGHRAGDVASEMATSSLHKEWLEADELQKPEQAEEWLGNAIQSVNDEIRTYASEHEECFGMGTTIVAAICTDSFATIAHIGDSRIYFANAFGFKQLTEDHSLVNELVRSGQISQEEADHHPRKNVLLKALGTEQEIQADIQTITFEEDNRLLLCTDGLTNKVSDEEIETLASFDGDWHSFCEDMVETANERGGEDNITLAVVHYQQDVTTKEGAD
ncbi:Stp1/IreP family PP2C-type Ser/Thr phosphatase [Halobacillus litoralis]|uniref:Stp1/IreP family PP2C-type Ser/Thr phosphatase n=1 Tax=Halobacillus litoralis TaxID=45668 RepID=UPI001CD1ADC6|nr:Stp1/IreP family PP2C-type Ser/Thr phosphatase [Halobacillus litoralis]MCA0969251.1 Stp1/IreP family PP2C-type Ser/Thr phosphatase [Halobacillus litoralis]